MSSTSERTHSRNGDQRSRDDLDTRSSRRDTDPDADSSRGTKRTREYNDLDPNFDRHGHPATSKLFLDKLPNTIKEETVRTMFKHFTKTLIGIQLGNKELRQMREAVLARQELQHYQLDDWLMPIVINFAKVGSSTRPSYRNSGSGSGSRYDDQGQPPTYHHHPQPAPYYSPNPYYSYLSPPYYPPPHHGYPAIMDREPTPPSRPYYYEPSPSPPPNNFNSNHSPHHQHNGGYPLSHHQHVVDPFEMERDKLGNRACATLFVTNFEPRVSEEDVRNMVPRVRRVMLSTKTLSDGEFRTGYLVFDSVQTAVTERNRLIASHQLNIHYSKRPQDQNGNNNNNNNNSVPSSSHHHHHHQQQVYVSPSPPPPSHHHHHHLYNQQPPPSSSSHHGHQHQIDPYTEYYYDHRGNPASSTLFVDCLPPDVDEEAVFRVFSIFGPSSIKVGRKELRENEFRTCVVYFPTMEQAAQARSKLNGAYFDRSWRRVMVINFRSSNSSHPSSYSSSSSSSRR